MEFMSCIRNGVFTAILNLIVVAQVINISVDPFDRLTGMQDAAINEVESCVEFVLEVLLDKHNAIEETDEPDHSAAGRIAASSILVFCATERHVTKDSPLSGLLSKNFLASSVAFSSIELPVHSPPPKFI